MSTVASLDRSQYVSLATYRRSGAEVRTPVWCAALDGKIYVFSAGDAGKVKRLRQTSRVRIAACDARGGVRDRWYEATARLLTEPDTIERARGAFRAKYGWRIRLFDAFASLAGRVRRRSWIEITPAD